MGAVRCFHSDSRSLRQWGGRAALASNSTDRVQVPDQSSPGSPVSFPMVLNEWWNVDREICQPHVVRRSDVKRLLHVDGSGPWHRNEGSTPSTSTKVLLMKKCTACEVSKPHSEFHKRARASDGLQSWCKSCKAKQHTEYFAANKHVWRRNEERTKERSREYILQMFLTGCIDCGTKDPRVLTFDHIGDDKQFDVANGMKRGLPNLKREIAKCEVVCANCHMIRTASRAGSWRSKLGPFV